VTARSATRRRGARLAAPCVILISLLFLPAHGCFWFTSASAGEQLRADVDKLRADLDALQANLEQERQAFETMRTQAEEQVAQLRLVLEQTTQVLSLNSADFGAQFEDLADDVRRLRGKIDEALAAFRGIEAASATQTRRLDRLERAAGLDPEIDPDEAPATADELWAKAQEQMTQADYPTARAFFRLFASRYADDPRTPSTATEIGVALAQEGRYGDAIAQLATVAQTRPDAPEMDRVFYYTALSLFGLSRCDEARTMLRAMLRKFPESTLKPAADELTEKLRTDARCR
jgi:TolA-binding protein